MICERCGKEVYKFERCGSCNRRIGYECVKNSKRISKTERAVICKDDWSNIGLRKRYKGLMETS